MAMGTVNKVTLVGPLGADPQIRRTTTGRKAAILNIETSDYWQDKAIAKSRTQWHRVVIYNERLAEIAERYLCKGTRVYIEGVLETRKWLTKDGKGENWTAEVIVSGFQGRLTILDELSEARPLNETLEDEPLEQRPSTRRWAEKHDAEPDDKIDSNLPFLA